MIIYAVNRCIIFIISYDYKLFTIINSVNKYIIIIMSSVN